MEFNLSRIALGLWRLKEWNYSDQELEKLVNQTLELGITTYDHADIYGNYECEKLFGNVLKLNPSLRSQMLLVTKCGIKPASSNFPERKIGHYDTRKEHILYSVDNSLKNLSTDYIDLLLIHRPSPIMNADEVANAFEDLKKSGKVLNFGVSNFLPQQFTLLQSRLNFPLVTNQIEVSILHHEHFDNGNIDFLQERRVAPMVWSPFARGKIFTDKDEKTTRVRNLLYELTSKYTGSSLEAMSTAWLLVHPVKFCVIIGSGKIDRIKAALNGLEINLTNEDWFRIWVKSRGENVP
jgi:predicted oxidoreductase